MKLQLDTTNKTVKVEGSVNLEALYETLQKLLPKGEWKQFSLEANTTIEWSSPIVIPYYPYYPTTPYPWWTHPGTITYNSNGIGELTLGTPNEHCYVLNKGTYNIELT